MFFTHYKSLADKLTALFAGARRGQPPRPGGVPALRPSPLAAPLPPGGGWGGGGGGRRPRPPLAVRAGSPPPQELAGRAGVQAHPAADGHAGEQRQIGVQAG